MLDYIINVLIFQTLFLGVYDLFIKRETFFQWNRVYLILTSLLAYIIPLLKIDQVTEIVSQEYLIVLPEVVLSPTTIIEQNIHKPVLVFNYLEAIFWSGVILAIALFIFKLFRIIQLIYNNEKEHKGNYFLVFLKNSNAFSFFNYIFLGKTMSQKSKEQIIEHELIHVQQKHSIDLLIFELQKIVFWFNPFSYIFQHRISELHEFIADSKAIKEKDKTSYFNNLLTETFGVQHISFINPFFKHSLIKKRIVMLHKSKSKQILKLKYLFLIPILLSMLAYTSCEKSVVEHLNKNEKRLTSIFMGSLDNSGVKEMNFPTRERYFDLYLNTEPAGKEISYNNLSDDEKKEYDKINNAFNKIGDNFNIFKIYEDRDGKRALFQEFDWKGLKKRNESKDYSNADEVPFAVLDKAPIFPGCEYAEDPKKCFQESISDYVTKNFDPSIANTLGLEKGKKRIYVQFLIKKNGHLSDIRARGPHETLEEEAKNIIYELPDMVPGEHNGKKVGVKYTLPISFVVE